MRLMPFQADEIIKTALLEDINYIDVTTDYLVDENAEATAYYLAKDSGVLCGLEIALRVFTLLDGDAKFVTYKHEGERVQQGDILAEITAKTRAVLKGERTALNLLQHMSGIATQTRRCVDLVAGTRASIADTRKTLPGLRVLQKYAVTVGGGKNHRFNLSDCAMLKDTHLDAYGSMTGAVTALREKLGHTVKIEVEVSNFEQLDEALSLGVEIIMLDNMPCEQMAEAVKITAGRAILEASGNVTEENIRAIAETGVDMISLGALTHSVKNFDISMKIKK